MFCSALIFQNPVIKDKFQTLKQIYYEKTAPPSGCMPDLCISFFFLCI